MSTNVTNEVIVPCRIVCETVYYSKDSVEWHRPVNKEAKIVTQVVREGDFELRISSVSIEGKAYPITGIRPGLEGRVVALLVVEGYTPKALYTNILTSEGEGAPPSDFLERYASGHKHRWR